ncbi:carboxypeptidase regulatory-like domain-containing protein [Myroides sp. LJL116]
MKKPHWLLIAVLVLFCNLVVAQRIEGRVFDKQNNQPLNKAQIDLFSRTGKKLQSVSTDFNGNYYYQGPDAQEVYKVAGSAQGYTTAEVIVNSGANGTLVIFGLVQSGENSPYSNSVSSSAQGLNIAPKAFESNEISKQKQEQAAKEIAALNQKHQNEFPHNVAAVQAANTSATMPQGVYKTNAVVSPSSNAVVSPSSDAVVSPSSNAVVSPSSNIVTSSSSSTIASISSNAVVSPSPNVVVSHSSSSGANASVDYPTSTKNKREAVIQEKDNFTTIQTPQGNYTTNATVSQKSYHSFQDTSNDTVARDRQSNQSYQDTSAKNNGSSTNEKVIPATKLVPATKQTDNDVSYKRANTAVDFIYFDFNSSYFNSTHDFELMQIVNHLLENNQHNIDLTVYVDRNSPNFEYQHWLNQRRGQRIYDYLVANGIHRNRINLKIQDLSSNPPSNASMQRMLRQCGFEISA